MISLLLLFKNSRSLKIAGINAVSRGLLILIVILSSQQLSAQTLTEIPVVFKDWKILGESKNHIDVSYRIVRCDTTNAVELKIRSESNKDETIHFTVKVVNSVTGEIVVTEVNLPVARFKELVPTCGPANPFSTLQVKLPASFDPNNINSIILF